MPESGKEPRTVRAVIMSLFFVILNQAVKTESLDGEQAQEPQIKIRSCLCAALENLNHNSERATSHASFSVPFVL